MHRYIFIIALFFLSHYNLVSAQTLLSNNQSVIYNNIPQEKIFVHYNSTLLFSGDYLYYKIYNINSQTNTLSSLSKIAYIELINKDKQTVFKHKIKLNPGVGKGDFFIPTSLPSGNYKLIAYTQWMRNVGDNYYFQGDICIINPFLNNQNEISIKSTDSIVYAPSPSDANKKNKYVELKVNAKTFSKREKVVLEINAFMNESSFGNYSISVRKIDSVSIPYRSNANSYDAIYPPVLKSRKASNKNLVYLPELRGELLSGKVLEKDTDKQVPVKNVSLSISGKNSIFKSSVTNNSGMFYFNLDKPYEALNADLHVIDDNPEKYKIILTQDTPLNYDDLVFSDFKISSEMKELILERSINNQIENAYSIVKQHKIKPEKKVTSFYNGQGITYNLDDFTRFKTVKETIVEIVNDAWIEKRNGIDKFKIKIDQPTNKNLSSLIIVDGLLTLNHDDLINYDARKIEKISVINNRYRYGGNIFEGILAVETINGDFKNNASSHYSKNITLIKPQSDKGYFNQTYNGDESLKRIPDYRNQLYWEPNFNLNQKESIITFYTSDYAGKYEINLEGFTKDGIPVSIKETISVK